MNVLISSASRKVELIRAFQKALAQEGGGKVVAIDASPLAPALYFADEHFLVPLSNSAEFLDVMLRICKQYNIRLIVPTRDEELLFFAEHKYKFADINTIVMISDLESVRICQDKRLFIKFCQERNISIPKTYESNSLPPNINYPLFIKPCFGKSSYMTKRINSKEELKLALEQIPNPLIQQFIQAPEYSVDIFADFSGKIISVVPRERIRTFGGESFVSRTSLNSSIIQESIRLIIELGLIGHNTIQCFFDSDIVKFIEVNPRFGGAANLGFAAGTFTPLFLVKLLKGEKLQPRIGEFKDNYVMLRYTEDLFINANSITNRKFQ